MTEPRIVRPNGGYIILPQRFIDVGMPRSGLSMRGEYQLVKRDARGVELERTPWFDNLLLTSGLNRMGTGIAIAGAAIGTDNTAPNAAQTGLLVESTYTTTAGTGSGASALGSSPYNNTYTWVKRTALGALNGNYSEVGVGWVSGSMFSRALILDGGGSPTTISVTSAQQLDIIYRLSLYPPLTDIGPTSITISGVSYSVTGRAAYVNLTSNGAGASWNPQTVSVAGISSSNLAGSYSVYSGTMGVITAGPGGNFGTCASNTNDSYSNGSLQRTAYASYGLTDGNIAGSIKSTMFWWREFAGFQYEFNPVIPKDSTKTLVLHYSINWAARP